jgi:phosphatidylglycerol---prolipoprotein diacylglyceryl transferase
LADAAAPAMILAYGIGRIGCQVSGDGDWGIANPAPKPGWMNGLPDWLWAYRYPNNVNGVGVRIGEADPWPIFEGFGTYLEPAVFPTPLYETLMATAIFAVLWALRSRIRIPGRMFALYLVFNGLERLLIEQIRVNAEMDVLGLRFTQAELIAVLTLVGGGVLWWALGKGQGKPEPSRN